MTHPATIKRWCDVLFIALLAAGTFAYAGPVLSFEVQSWLSLAFGHGLFGAALLALVGLASLVRVMRFASTEFQHARHLLRYPPLPIALILGLLTAPFVPQIGDGLLSKVPRLSWVDGTVVTVAFLLVWLMYTGTRRIRRQLGQQKQSLFPRRTSEKISDEALKVWLRREDPIEDHDLDLFGHAAVADRLVQRLQREDSSIALQGEFGSGKSSVCQIAETESKRRGLNLIFVHASCWGFENAVRAQKEVLDAILREVGKEVDCLSIRELPDAYIDAFSSQTSWVKALLHVGGTRFTPLEQLQRLCPILAAIGKTVVVVIEDVDRTGNRFDVTQIQALLMQFRGVSGLSFILAISPLQHVDFAKLCDYLEVMPTVDRGQMLRLIHQTREMLLREHPPGILLDKPQPLVSNDGDYRVFDVLMRYSLPWQLGLCGLLNRPRLLKHALRRLCDAWLRLRGEVNIDDLLSVAALRIGAPDAFEFLCERFPFFAPAMQTDDARGSSGKNVLQEKLMKEWNQLCSAGRFDPESAASVLKQAYPATATVTGVSAVHGVVRQSMQSKRRSDVYARRLFTEHLEPNEVRDQVLLELMHRVAPDSGALSEIANLITDSEPASAAFEDFADAMNFKDDLRLLTEVYAVIRKRHGPRADRDQYPGFFGPWRRLNDNRPKGFEDWLLKELTKCIPGHLRLLTDIYYFWLGTDRHPHEERLQARKAILDGLRTAWNSASPQSIAAGFDTTFPYTLFHLVFTSDYDQPDTVPLGKVEDWVWSGPILLKAAKVAPAIMLPQTLIALNSSDERGRPEMRYTLDQERLEKWFGRNSKELLSLAAQSFDIHPETAETTKYLLRLAVDKIRSELARREPPTHKP